ncbi:MAG: hypothetical protein KAS32_16540 [Candidatus Peribacteraceae bacterium]|nr:hypothetical protein [Candidatus Peribacteraceae bacterium]
MPDNLVKWLIDVTPCVGLVAGKYTIDTAKIVQAVIIALISGLLINVMMIPKIQVIIEHMGTRIEKIEFEVEEMRRDFYKPQVSDG